MGIIDDIMQKSVNKGVCITLDTGEIIKANVDYYDDFLVNDNDESGIGIETVDYEWLYFYEHEIKNIEILEKKFDI